MNHSVHSSGGAGEHGEGEGGPRLLRPGGLPGQDRREGGRGAGAEGTLNVKRRETERQTDRQTDKQTELLPPSENGEVQSVADILKVTSEFIYIHVVLKPLL